MGRRITAGAALVMALVVSLPARAQTPSVEEDLLELINRARSRPLVMHEGLRATAREHAAAMAAADAITHSGARSRVFGAAPDPRERGGAPDNGFTGTWCEVAGWEPSNRDENVAQQFYDAWQAKSEDATCMSHPSMTVAGVGVYARGNRWWASLELVQDRSVPRRAAPVARATAAPSAAPATTHTPRPTSNSSSSAVGAVATSRPTSSNWFPMGWPGLFVAIGGFAFVPILHTLRRRFARR